MLVIKKGTKVEFRTKPIRPGNPVRIITNEPGFHTTVHKGTVTRCLRHRGELTEMMVATSEKEWRVPRQYIRRLPRGLTVSG